MATELESQSFVRFKNDWGVVFSISLPEKTVAIEYIELIMNVRF